MSGLSLHVVAGNPYGKLELPEKSNKKIYMEGLEIQFYECVTEKNCSLIRSDFLQSFRNVYDVVGDQKIREKSLALIETDQDIKYRKKYATLWRK